LIGSAQFLPLADLSRPDLTDPNTRIVQHFIFQPLPLPGHFDLLSGATAVIEDLTVLPEHATRDLRLEITRGAGAELVHREVYYNVPVSPAGLPGDPALFPNLTPTSLHLAIPAAGLGVNSVTDAIVELPADGTPPNFADLLGAMNVVLGNDPGGAPSIANLTPQQCRHIAYEIAWNRSQHPLPDRNKLLLEDIYTAPDDGNDKQDREEFEGQLLAYYARHNAEADRLTAFVFAVSAAVFCEERSAQTTEVRFRFPVRLGPAPASGKINEAEVVLHAGGAPVNPPFVVPAAYFYALGAVMSTQVTAEQRYKMATLDSEQRVRDELTRAIDLFIITEPAAVNRNQAARRLTALGTGKAGAPRFALSAAVGDPVHDLVQAWLNHLAIDIASFWVAATPVHDAGHLELVLCAITQNHLPLIAAIKAPPFSVANVPQLAAKTVQQWRDLFLPSGLPPQILLLPPFTRPGSIEERVAAFIRHVKKFFEVLSGAAGITAPIAGAPPTLGQAGFDPVVEFFNEYNSLSPGFTFGTPFNEGNFQTALSLVFPGDSAARDWLE
jgi:hypothetical protein